MSLPRILCLIVLPALMSAAIAGCSHTERTVYVKPAEPPPSTVIVPAPAYSRY